MTGLWDARCLFTSAVTLQSGGAVDSTVFLYNDVQLSQDPTNTSLHDLSL